MDDNLESVSFAISAAGRSYGKFPMVFEHIDKLKREYTDKYVVVDNSRPELRRFDGQTGLVRTVNMNGRALVEFDAYENIGWYDIDIDFLKIIDKPLPKPEPKEQPAKKPAAKKPAAKKAESKKAPAAGGMSVEEMLAAARGEKAGAATKPAPAAKAETSSGTQSGAGRRRHVGRRYPRRSTRRKIRGTGRGARDPRRARSRTGCGTRGGRTAGSGT